MPNESSNYDDALLARLNALKTSNVSFGPKETSSTEISSEGNAAPKIGQDSLIDRFRSFTAVAQPQSQSSPESEQDEDDGRTVEDLLAELGPDDQWTLHPEEPDEMQKLLDEARQLLLKKEEQPLSKDSEDPSQSSRETKPVAKSASAGAPASTSEADIEAAPPQTEDEEAAIYLQQILDELELEEHDESTKEPYNNEDAISGQTPPRDLQTEGPQLVSLEMPSVPTSIPIISQLPTQDDTTPTFDLPSAPTIAPQRKLATQSVNSKLPQYSDKDIETWCTICNDDATVRCLGCEGDLYCAKCWKEGHMGKEVGYDERSHRWVKYKQR
ncbi:hypothetical protein MMC11_009066 [Xylographa trunciseda]|nr:hypothetical protein [Xylographa trunciseda]